MDDKEYEDEFNHWESIMRTFLLYEDFVSIDVTRRQAHLNRLPNASANHLPDITFRKTSMVIHKSRKNQSFFNAVVNFQDYGFGPRTSKSKRIEKYQGVRIPASQMHRNQAILHSLVREWSLSGAEERNLSFRPLLDELQIQLPVNPENAYKQRVLVPGCGLARLPIEIAALGYACQANEFSMFMLTPSHFLLNGNLIENQFEIFPYLDRTCNLASVQDSLEGVLVPDFSANNILSSSPYYHIQKKIQNELYNENSEVSRSGYHPPFSMAAGDFVALYSDEENAGQWDAIVTCFFMDTAPVIIDYITTIKNLLRPGGVWINLGPLLYHWSAEEVSGETANDERYDQSIELSYEELRHVIQSYGFRYIKEEWRECGYTGNKKFMMWPNYRCVFFTVTKEESEVTPSDSSQKI